MGDYIDGIALQLGDVECGIDERRMHPTAIVADERHALGPELPHVADVELDVLGVHPLPVLPVLVHPGLRFHAQIFACKAARHVDVHGVGCLRGAVGGIYGERPGSTVVIRHEIDGLRTLVFRDNRERACVGGKR